VVTTAKDSATWEISVMGDHGRLLVIEHELDAPAGLLGPWARARGLDLSTVHLGGGDRLPARLPEAAGVVVLGSERTAFDDDIPWLAGELDLVRQALADGVPLLGICFGGQVLARALGARVYRLAEPMIGWVRLASQHPGLAGGPWLEWHRDGFDLPPGARELATGGASVQAYAIGPHLGLQFHPEATEPITQDWLRATQPPLTPAQAGRLNRGWKGAAARTTAEAGVLFSAWLDGEFAAAVPGTGPDPAAVAAQQ
jgi:GMP synthase-like glutamine amidotransferase